MVCIITQLVCHYHNTVQGKTKKMNSAERHEVRYQRRKAKRIEKRKIIQEKYCVFEKVFSFDNLYESYKKCCKGVNWKTSTQSYKANALLNIYKAWNDLMNGSYRSKGFIEFDITERGKPRHIKSVHISERVVQKCFCDYSLNPLLKRYFIYDNGASIKHKGIDFAMNRLNCFLEKSYREYGNRGYALVFDFSKYFENIEHDILLDTLRDKITDTRLYNLLAMFIKNFGEKGLGLGSQVSQINAIMHPNYLDHYIKDQLGIKYYCRYMDDGVLVHPSKAYLQYCLQELKMVCAELGIKLNSKKTQIVKLSRGIKFLKVRFVLTATDKVIRKHNKKNNTRMRHKLKYFKSKFDNNEMDINYIVNCFKSWRGSQKRYNSYWATRRMDEYFYSLFPQVILKR